MPHFTASKEAAQEFSLTEKELKAAKILVTSCFTNMGGKRPADLERDEFTWVSIEDLMAEGYSQHEAAGLFSSLRDKGLIAGDAKQRVGDVLETFMTTEAWKYLDQFWA